MFGLENRYPEVEKTCRKYLCDEQPEVVFSVTQQKTDSLHLGRTDGENESTALHACIVQHLIPQDYLLFHGSCLALDGQAILFTAPSGTGKSTHSRLWRERFGSRVQMVNDDKPLLQLTPPTAGSPTAPPGAESTAETPAPATPTSTPPLP